jgi:hypothetical protein
MTWNDTFLTLFDRCSDRFRAGDTDFETYYSAADLKFLGTIGYQKREFFDFVEDHCDDDKPSISTALLVAAVRRDYFQTVMQGKLGEKCLCRDDVPAFEEEIAGIAYLPRLIAKGRAKLRGELDPDLMFGCGGDRKFLSTHGNIHPADFLRHVWAAGDDDRKIIDWVKQQAG